MFSAIATSMESASKQMENAINRVTSDLIGSQDDTVVNCKLRIQEGFRRAYSAKQEYEKEGLVITEAGEGEWLEIQAGSVSSLTACTYGACDSESDSLDVMRKLEQDLLSGKKIRVSNDTMGGDPKPGTRKVLRIWYRPASDIITAATQEGKELQLPSHAAEGILSATYGSGDVQQDVMIVLQAALLSANGKPLTVTNDLLGGDPLPGSAKTLTVKYDPTRTRLAFKLQTARELATFGLIAPWLFKAQRSACGLSLDDYFHSLTNEDLSGGEKQASGKSGEIFWFTADKRYVLKTIPDAEVATLVKMLPEYTAYLNSNPDSMLTRYLGVYSLEDNGRTTQFVVMNNIFEGSPTLDVMYDLKGTTEDRWVDPEPGKCLKDNNFAESTVYCDDATAAAIHSAIISDTKFLEKQGIMDYSLMMALSYDPSFTPTCHRYSKLIGGIRGLEAKGVSDETVSECIIFIGMVDMLVTYGWKKVAAHNIKAITIGWKEEIDTVAPDRYAARFREHFGLKIRGKSEQVNVTMVSPADFETPMPAMGRSGGTAAFFKVTYKDGVSIPEAKQSKAYWIGKDLARAKDEVAFYEAAKGLQGAAGWELLKWMTPYMGVCRADCHVVQGKPPQLVDVMLLRNGRDGYTTCRMLDIKMGQVTAVAGWQGKSAVSAWLQANTVDALTNSSGQGFRLEGFDSPPEALMSYQDFLTHGDVASLAAGAKKVRRFCLQNLKASQFISFFLDLHGTSSSSYAKAKGKATSSAAPEPESGRLSQVETQELVLLSCIEELSHFLAACRKAPAPQQWIGSSVMLCFDSGSRPAREVLTRGSRAWGCARVHIFDWGRSELNTAAMHARLEDDKKAERQKYWGYYCGAVAMLLYDCCNLYVRRFWHAKESLALTVWDKDKDFMPDTFVGLCTVPLAETGEEQTLVDWKGGSVKSGMLRTTQSSLAITVKPRQLDADSRLRDCWTVKVHGASNLPCKDALSPNDSFAEVAAFPEEAAAVLGSLDDADAQHHIRVGAHVTTLAEDRAVPVWEEEFEIATLEEGARMPFYKALSTALGIEGSGFSPTALEAQVEQLFPCHPSKAPCSSEAARLQVQFVGACLPGLELPKTLSSMSLVDA
mmetsp:Transcript_48431/g.122187  ORF Transcript_48431/g.122187 Transcript_48431/m.122187 type:complete len:1110 (-) Transcript_48431:2-3331(-)